MLGTNSLIAFVIICSTFLYPLGVLVSTNKYNKDKNHAKAFKVKRSQVPHIGGLQWPLHNIGHLDFRLFFFRKLTLKLVELKDKKKQKTWVLHVA